ncbi:MAG: hypothetical protein J5849_06420 [Clostridia bacterium]|nr:hypothetical protein [Clostridia bacterium]
MKVTLIQPRYSADFSEAEELFQWELDALRSLDGSSDLILLPESADVPALARTEEERALAFERFNAPLLAEAKKTAKRCRALVILNARRPTGKGLRNSTFVFDREGNEAGHYDKEHLTPGESKYLEADYTWRREPVQTVTVEGLKLAFLTCYDFYFYEAAGVLAREKPDLIIGCSHQRSDTKTALEMMASFFAYNVNAYVLRASVSMGEDAAVGGCSMAAAPDGRVLLDMESRVGIASVEIDPRQKYEKPAGYGNPPSSHFAYTEKGRRPWKYRPAGPFIVLPDDRMPYPRVCAHRGFNTVAPENSLPAFGAAVSSGAEEIEFDLWHTADGEIVSIHDCDLDRVSDGHGRVWEKTLAELKRLDFGGKFGEAYRGLPIPTFEEILREFSGRCVMNIHVKTYGDEYPVGREYLEKIVSLLREYDAERHAYFMCGDDRVLEILGAIAPDVHRCVGAGKAPFEQVERAIRLGCEKIQLFEDKFTPDMIVRAHAHGILVTAFYADTPERARTYLELGVDTVLTNDYWRVSRAVEAWKREKGI